MTWSSSDSWPTSDADGAAATRAAGAATGNGAPFSPTLDIVPTSRWPTRLPDATIEAVLASRGAVSPARHDVVCLGLAGPDARGARARALMAEFARRGHRVLAADPGSSRAAPSLATLEGLRRRHGIEAALAYVLSPAWAGPSLEARACWGWRMVYDPASPEATGGSRRGTWAGDEHRLGMQADVLVTDADGAGAPAERCDGITRCLGLAFPRASVVIPTVNNLVYTKLCVESTLANTEYPNYELIVVDNGSEDGTAGYLREVSARHGHVRTLVNERNMGFAAAINQGLGAAGGDVLVCLNDDTLVPRGWLTRLVHHLADPTVGLVGPVTNRTCNEAQIDVPYRTYGEFLRFARERGEASGRAPFEIRMLAMFCVAMPRRVYERVGPLDDRFGVALFEDEDYALRVRAAGLRVVCAEDTFVHHFGQASVGKLAASGEYGRLFEANRRRFEAKWGIVWRPHERRRSPAYRELLACIRATVGRAVPCDATVLVVSKGDDALLELEGRRGWHFPMTEDGVYAGHHPADSAEAIAQLENGRAKGGGFLLVPETARWWLDHYQEFARHLAAHYRRVADDPGCTIYALGEPRRPDRGDADA